MLVTFKTRAYADITMFGDIGRKMLEMMDFGARVPGAIRAEDLPAALDNLERALARIPRQANHRSVEADEEPRIDLHTRAVPLIDLLRAAIADEANLRWE